MVTSSIYHSKRCFWLHGHSWLGAGAKKVPHVRQKRSQNVIYITYFNTCDVNVMLVNNLNLSYGLFIAISVRVCVCVCGGGGGYWMKQGLVCTFVQVFSNTWYGRRYRTVCNHGGTCRQRKKTWNWRTCPNLAQPAPQIICDEQTPPI